MKFTTKKREEFLELLKDGTPVIHACTKISMSNVAMYNHRRSDENFAQQWNDAVEQGEKIILNRLEQEADRRATEGYLKPIYYNGVAVGAERRYSDVLLIVRLKALAPERYKDRVDATVTAEVNVNVVAAYRDAIKDADALRTKAEHKRLNGLINGNATNGNGHARSD